MNIDPTNGDAQASIETCESNLNTAGKPTLSVDTIINDIKSGLSRAEIAYKYNMNVTEKRMVFNHPRIKGMRKNQPVRFELVD